MRGLPRREFRLQLRELESRWNPSISVVLSGSSLAFTGDAAADQLSITTNAAGFVSHNLAGSSGLESATDLDPAPGVQQRLANALSGITIDLGAGSDLLDISRVPAGIAIANVEAFRFSLAANEADGDIILSNAALTVNDVLAPYMYSLVNSTVTQITGAAGNNSIDASSWSLGNLTLYGLAGHDTLRGGSGHDFLEGNDGDDTLDSGAGNDLLDWNNFSGTSGNDTLLGGPGNDSLGGGFGDDTLDGGDGDDFLSGNVGLDTFQGGAGYDRLEDSFLSNAILTNISYVADGLTSPDHRCEYGTLFGSDANNIIDLSAFTGPGSFTVYGFAGNDTIRGGAGHDMLDGGDGDDILIGNGGNDTLAGGTGDDDLDGGFGNDALFGFTGLDKFQGGPGIDRLDDHIATDVILTDSLYLADGIASTDHGCEYGNITGSDGDNTIDLSNWNGLGFSLAGGGGNDLLRGRAGNSFQGGSGFDTTKILGTDGPDLIRVSGSSVSINGVAATFDHGIESLEIDAKDGIDRGELLSPVGLSSFTVLNLEPTVALGQDIINADESYKLLRTGSFEDIGTGQAWTASVDYGDGSGFVPLSVQPDQSFVLDHNYLSDGIFPVTVRVMDNQGNLGENRFSVRRTFRLQLGDATPQRSQIGEVKVAFSGAATLSPGWLTFERLTPGAMPTVTTAVHQESGKTVATIAFSGAGLDANGSLADGRYRLTLHGANIQGAELPGNFDYEFHRIFGDANGDRAVDAVDFASLGNAFGLPSAGSPFDGDSNGIVDAVDLAAFGNRFGLTL